MDDKREIKKKKREPLHAKEPLCRQDNEEYYLNRYPKKAKTEGMYYYFQKVDGITIKTEVTKEQWSALYAFNKKALRHDLKFYDDRYFTRFPVYEDEDGNEDDPMEHQADTFYTVIKTSIKRLLSLKRKPTPYVIYFRNTLPMCTLRT